MPPDEKGRPYNGEYCAACGQDCQSMVISQQNIAQQNRRIFLSVIGGIFIVAVPDHTLETMYITVVGYSWFVIATMVFK